MLSIVCRMQLWSRLGIWDYSWTDAVWDLKFRTRTFPGVFYTRFSVSSTRIWFIEAYRHKSVLSTKMKVLSTKLLRSCLLTVILLILLLESEYIEDVVMGSQAAYLFICTTGLLSVPMAITQGWGAEVCWFLSSNRIYFLYTRDSLVTWPSNCTTLFVIASKCFRFSNLWLGFRVFCCVVRVSVWLTLWYSIILGFCG